MSVSIAITATTPRTRGSALLKLSLTELRLLSRERVRMALPIAIPLVLLIILGSIHSFRQPVARYGKDLGKPKGPEFAYCEHVAEGGTRRHSTFHCDPSVQALLSAVRLGHSASS